MRLSSKLSVGVGLLSLVAASTLTGCSGDDAFNVIVEARTDLVPGVDFVTVDTRLADEPIGTSLDTRAVSLTDLSGSDFIAGHRVAEFIGTKGGPTYVRVRLIGAGGETVLSRDTVIDLRGDTALTVVLASSCTGVLCPGTGDPATHTACLGGSCVDPRCTPDDPTYCGEAQCVEDADCASSSVGCRSGICSDRTCLSAPDDARCGAGEACSMDGSCIAAAIDSGMPRDSGPVDSGPVDSGAPDTRPMTTGMFCPDIALTRRQMSLFLVRYEHGVDFVPPPAVGTFSDVPVGSLYAEYIEQLARDAITLGCGGGLFCPDDPVRREQAATFLVRANYGPGYVPPAPTGVFSDVSVASPHAPAIEQIYRDGITQGCGTGLFCPGDDFLRRNLAVFLVRMVHGATYTPPPAVGLFTDVPVGSFAAPYIEQLARDGYTLGC